jgi:hypothetical protein
VNSQTEHILNLLADINPEAKLADGFEDALVGYTTGSPRPVLAVYDRARCIEILVHRDGMSLEEAEDFFSYNTEAAYVGEHTPLFVEFPRPLN